MIAEVTAPLATALNGVAAGIMLSTVVGIVPMMVAQPYTGYVRMVQFLWPRYDPMMPALNGGAMVLGVVSAVAVGPVPARPMLILAAALLACVMAISITKNVPVNRYVGRLDPASQPDDWTQADPRSRWRRWNLIRTSIALVAFATNVTAIALLR
jgi:uncharacterized membrane protein